jgi:hypothetical protein
MNTSSQQVRRARVIIAGLPPVLLLLGLLSGCQTSSEKLVTVHSVVDPSYVAARTATEPPRTDTYAMAAGNMLQRSPYNAGLEKVDFHAMAKTLAADLKAAHFEPATSVGTADLVIVVHWGIAGPEEKWSEQALYDPDALRQAQDAVTEARAKEQADTTGLSRALGVAAAAEANFRAEINVAASVVGGNEMQAASHAALLGFTEVLRIDDAAPAPTATGDTLRSMLEEDRYFVILVAYDAKALRAGRKRQIWTTQMSISAAGLNFPAALDRMSGVAASQYGVRKAAITIQNGVERLEKVEVGEIPMLGANRP